jgi:hypothetical protein
MPPNGLNPKGLAEKLNQRPDPFLGQRVISVGSGDSTAEAYRMRDTPRPGRS